VVGHPNSFFTKNPPQPQGPNESGRLFQYLEQFDVWAAMAVLPDSPKKYRYLEMMRDHLSNLIVGGAFCPAGEMIYHGGFHMAYAFAMPTKFANLAQNEKGRTSCFTRGSKTFKGLRAHERIHGHG